MFKWLAKETQTYLTRARDPGNLGASSSLLFKFASQQDLAQWNVFSDKEHGGKSEAELRAADDQPDTACFSGRIDSQLAEASDPNARALKRSGFAGMNSEEREYLDIDTYDHLVFRVKGDGRKYIASLRTDNWVIGGRSHDVWQAFLFARKGGWQEVNIPLDRFLLTWRGKLVDSEQQLNPQRIVSIGIALAGLPWLQEEREGQSSMQEVKHVQMLKVGLVADTHGVFDPGIEPLFQGVGLLLHAGDVGHHGGHEGVLAAFTALHPTIGVRGNVDGAASPDVLPEHRLLQLNGWRVLLLHICGLPPKLDPAAEQLVLQQLPDVVVFGHSHKHGAAVDDKRLFVNPGAAGAARFRLPRMAATLRLPERAADVSPSTDWVEFHVLSSKAPPRLTAVAVAGKRKRVV